MAWAAQKASFQSDMGCESFFARSRYDFHEERGAELW